MIYKTKHGKFEYNLHRNIFLTKPAITYFWFPYPYSLFEKSSFLIESI